MPEVLYGLSGELLAWYQYGEVLVVCFGPATYYGFFLLPFWIVAPTVARGLRRLNNVSETDEGPARAQVAI